MHSIRLKRLRFSNILSYGNTVNEVIFENGITWICGANGAGKSTIIEALTLAFFNKPYRSIKKEQLKNTANKSKLLVELEFDRIDNKSEDVYIVTRTMGDSGTTSTNISKNGVTPKKEASISQKKFEEEILGFNEILWQNVISLNTINSVPFIDMDPKEKRDLLESVLTTCIDQWKELNKTASKEARTKFEGATSDVVKYSKDLVEFDGIIEKMQQERSDNIDALKKEIVTIMSDNKIKKMELNGITESFNTIVEQGKAEKQAYDLIGDVDSLLNKYNTIISILPMLESEKNDLSARLALFTVIQSELDSKKALTLTIDGTALKARYKEITAQILSNNRSLSSTQTESTIITRSMNDIKTKATAVVAGVPCHACGKPSTEDDVSTIKDAYRKEYADLRTKVANLTKQADVMQLEITKLENEQIVINNQIAEYDVIYNDYVIYEKNTYNPAKSAIDTIKRSISVKEAQINQCDTTDIDVLNSTIIELKTKKEEKTRLEKVISDLRTELSTQRERKIGVENVIKTLDNQIELKKATIEEKQKNDTDDSLQSTIVKRDGVIKDLKTANEKVIKYSDEIEITKYIDKLCSDSGMKKIVLGIFVPNLNRAIMDNLRAFDLPYVIEFDDSMKYTFSSRYGLAEVYNGLSEGQKRKINFAIAMAFRDFVTKIGDFNVNLLFLDEVLDVSTDTNALRDMIMLLKNKVDDIGNIYIITHRGDDVSECFDNKLEIEHDGRYSSIKKRALTASKTKY